MESFRASTLKYTGDPTLACLPADPVRQSCSDPLCLLGSSQGLGHITCAPWSRTPLPHPGTGPLLSFGFTTSNTGSYSSVPRRGRWLQEGRLQVALGSGPTLYRPLGMAACLPVRKPQLPGEHGGGGGCTWVHLRYACVCLSTFNEGLAYSSAASDAVGRWGHCQKFASFVIHEFPDLRLSLNHMSLFVLGEQMPGHWGCPHTIGVGPVFLAVAHSSDIFSLAAKNGGAITKIDM